MASLGHKYKNNNNNNNKKKPQFLLFFLKYVILLNYVNFFIHYIFTFIQSKKILIKIFWFLYGLYYIYI